MKLISILAVALTVTAFSMPTMAKSAKRGIASSGMPWGGGGKLKGAAKCGALINSQVMDFNGGFDVDGAAVYVDEGGKVQVRDESKSAVTRTMENGVETIKYPAKVMKQNAYYDPSKAPEWETVQKTIQIRRDSQGRITGVTKMMDVAGQVKMQEQWKKAGYGSGLTILRSLDTEFSYDGDSCTLDQSMGLESTDAKAPGEKKVYFDKTFCDAIAPSIKQIGTNNVAMCGGLLNSAMQAFDKRNSELQKDGKSMKQYNYFSQTDSGSRRFADTFNISNAIQSCSMADMSMMGPYGFGMGQPGGYGYPGTYLGGGYVFGGGYGMMMGGYNTGMALGGATQVPASADSKGTTAPAGAR